MFSIYASENDISQVVKCDVFLYADNSYLTCQNKDINEIEKQLNEGFCNVCDWFVNNNLSLHLRENKQNHDFLLLNFKKGKI